MNQVMMMVVLVDRSSSVMGYNMGKEVQHNANYLILVPSTGSQINKQEYHADDMSKSDGQDCLEIMPYNNPGIFTDS